MNIVFDAMGVKSGGASLVLRELVRAAGALENRPGVTIFASPGRLRRFELPEVSEVRVLDVEEAEGSVGRFVWAMGGVGRRLAGMGCDVFVGLNGIGVLRRNRRYASVLFVQQPLPYCPEALRRCPAKLRFRMRVIGWLTGRSVRSADAVLVQTRVMKRALVDAFGLLPEKVSVFLPGAPELPPPGELPRLWPLASGQGSRPVLLYVGSDSPHKNLGVVADGLGHIPENKRPMWLVTLPESSTVCRSGAARGLGYLDRPTVHAVYRVASVFVMPSLAETVGLPMLEAMRVGVPVLAADRPYAREVCEDAAMFFDPLSPADFADKLTRLMADPALRAGLVARGHALVKGRDATNCYRAMLEKVIEVAERRKARLEG